MNFKINPKALGRVFVLPCGIVDEHIRLAGSAQLKVLLYVFRNMDQPCTAESLSRALGISPADISDAMQYWVECGIIDTAEGALHAVPPPLEVAAKPEPPAEPDKQNAKTCSAIPIPKPSSEDIAKRGEESPQLRYLFSQAQLKLGRVIGYSEQSALLCIHDYYGLPVEVILMILEYAVNEGKTGTAYIISVAKNWSEDGIDSLQKAEEKIAEIKHAKDVWTSLKTRAGLHNAKPTAKQRDFLSVWANKWGFDAGMIYLAYEEMADHTSKLSFPYINKVLENWYKNGIKTPEQVKDSKHTYTEKKAAQKQSENGPSSYDLDEFDRLSVDEPIIYNPSKAGSAACGTGDSKATEALPKIRA